MLELDVALQRGDSRLRVKTQLPGPVTGLFGPSGAGKSSLLHLIAGLLRPDAGSIRLNGRVLVDDRHWQPPHRRRVGMVFQESRLFPHYSVRGNLLYGAAVGAPSTFDEIVDLFELEPLLGQKAWQLSGGERQRVALGRALLSAPQLLLLDEPLAGLDRGLKRQILPYLRRMRAEARVPMVFVSHDLSALLQLTDNLLVLDKGQVVGQGRFLQLVKDARFLQLTHDLGLPNMLLLSLVAHRPREGLSLLQSGSGGPLIKGPPCELKPGEQVRVSLLPEAVALTRAEISGISIQNRIQGRVTHLLSTPQRVMCMVDVGFELLVEVTPHAVQELGLREGVQVWALFKAQALHYL